MQCPLFQMYEGLGSDKHDVLAALLDDRVALAQGPGVGVFADHDYNLAMAETNPNTVHIGFALGHELSRQTLLELF